MTIPSGTTNGFRALSLFAALALATLVAVGLLMLAMVVAEKPAKAAFPGVNGLIVFASNRTTGTGVNNPEGDWEIFTMNPNGTGLTQLTVNTVTANDYNPVFSADGQKIAFYSYRDGNPEIYTMDANGLNQTRLTNNTAADVLPAWSPDGTKIAFESNQNGNDYEVYTMDAVDSNNDGNGDNLTNVSNNPADDGQPTWSPNGTKIAFVSARDNNYEIYKMNSDGTNQTRLTKNPYEDRFPNWSPSGKKIAFQSNRLSKSNKEGDYEVYAMNSDGTRQRNRTKNAVADYDPAFSPDGTKIVFRTDRDGNPEIYTMKTDGTNQTNITNNSADDRNPDWQPL